MNMQDGAGRKARLAGGYLPAGKKIAAVLTAAMTLVVLILRVALTPGMQDPDTGLFHLSYIVIGLTALTMIAAAVLSWLSESGEVPPGGKLLTPLALSAMLAGSIMAVVSAVDGIAWLLSGETPPPNEHVISGIDGLTLLFTILFGLLGGVMLARTGIVWLTENRVRSGLMRLWALAPVGWVWMRLARYEVSYASAVSVSESFYDFVMLIFALLFFFAFARYLSGVGACKSRLLFFFALMTALFCLSGPLTRLFLYLTGQGDAYNASRLAGVTDGVVGAFALLFAFLQAFGKTPPVSEEAAPAEETKQPTVDDILKELYPSDE